MRKVNTTTLVPEDKGRTLLMEPMNDSTCKVIADFFSAFSSPIRMRIFCGLAHGPKTVTELANYAEVSLPNISQHLRIMRDKGVVNHEKSGQSVHYFITDEKFIEGLRMIRNALNDLLKSKANVVG